MGRWLYTILLRLHPRSFRERFGEEMAGIFDEEVSNVTPIGLLLDGVLSLFRQWILRPTHQTTAFSAAGPTQPSGIPVFHTFESRTIRRSALLNGVLLAIVCFAAVSFAINRGSEKFPPLLVGARHPRPHVLPVKRSSIMESELSTEIKVASPPVDPLYELANVYFKIIRVLDVLDANRDRDISAWEIATASSALQRLDWDGDGVLSAEECGFSLGYNPITDLDPAFVRRARLEFMQLNPVLAALDTDHNGEISADEIKRSPVSLRALDKNHDGILTPAEVLPNVH